MEELTLDGIKNDFSRLLDNDPSGAFRLMRDAAALKEYYETLYNNKNKETEVEEIYATKLENELSFNFATSVAAGKRYSLFQSDYIQKKIKVSELGKERSDIKTICSFLEKVYFVAMEVYKKNGGR